MKNLLELTGCIDPNASYIADIHQKLSYDTFYKCTASYLNAFIRVRLLSDLTDMYLMPNKGKPNDIMAGLLDKKTQGSYMIALAYMNRCKPVIDLVPVLTPIQKTSLFIRPPKVIKFQRDVCLVDTKDTALPWLVDYCLYNLI